MINNKEAVELKEKIKGLQVFMKEYAEAHKEEMNIHSFNAFIIALESQLKESIDFLQEHTKGSEAEKDIIKEAIDYYINALQKTNTTNDFEDKEVKRKVEQLKNAKYKYFVDIESEV